jgi:hypothetical protein
VEHVTASTSYVATQPLLSNHISLIHGWVSMTVQVVTAIALALANALTDSQRIRAAIRRSPKLQGFVEVGIQACTHTRGLLAAEKRNRYAPASE